MLVCEDSPFCPFLWQNEARLLGNDLMSEPDATLQQLMAEMLDAKQAVQGILKVSPEDIQLHRIHGMYTGHILDIRKTLIQEQAVDRDQLLIDALRGVVNFLLQKGEGESARIIGDHLEAIEDKVKLSWQDSKTVPVGQRITTTSGTSSPAPSRRSAKAPRRKKKPAGTRRAKA